MFCKRWGFQKKLRENYTQEYEIFIPENYSGVDLAKSLMEYNAENRVGGPNLKAVFGRHEMDHSWQESIETKLCWLRQNTVYGASVGDRVQILVMVMMTVDGLLFIMEQAFLSFLRKWLGELHCSE